MRELKFIEHIENDECWYCGQILYTMLEGVGKYGTNELYDLTNKRLLRLFEVGLVKSKSMSYNTYLKHLKELIRKEYVYDYNYHQFYEAFESGVNFERQTSHYRNFEVAMDDGPNRGYLHSDYMEDLRLAFEKLKISVRGKNQLSLSLPH